MNKLVNCFEITANQRGLAVNDTLVNQVLLIETPFLHPFLLFTDGTFVGFLKETGGLIVYRKGPCYIWHEKDTLWMGKTHDTFLIADKPNSLRGDSWD